MAGVVLGSSMHLAPARAENPVGRAKYVILLVGDGMGLAQRTLGELYLRAAASDGSPRLAMRQMPVV